MVVTLRDLVVVGSIGLVGLTSVAAASSDIRDFLGRQVSGLGIEYRIPVINRPPTGMTQIYYYFLSQDSDRYR